ncbi:TonB-dependent receptor plug domain-containing protein [Fretibacter rubidus]|uniref:TonB-dependent receptor plug domain-containing protein n=1 Tax=Fretibacter rubidus TaxID=570162 RepID=UPI00352AF1BE
MKNFTFKHVLAATASSAILGAMMATPSYAQSNTDVIEDEIISIGTRRTARSAADTPAPVDVISGVEFSNQAVGDITDLLRNVVPSYNVNTQPISDAATIIRPANLRGLSPDNTLVLLNGKRRHKGSVISFLGGGISDGAQGVDIGVFPSLALKQVEVLRDGASSQYGSDAIAGVINFALKDASEGGMVEASWGQTYKGDGDVYKIGANVGLPLGENGFVNITGEYGETKGTVRAADRSDVLALIAAGNTAVADFETVNSYTDEFAQYWGSPDIDDEIKLFVNAGYELSENAEVYAFGNYNERTATGGFFFRNPTNRGGVYRGPTINGGPSVLVGDLDGVGTGGSCPAGIPLLDDGLTLDPTVLATVTADPNCFSFVETIPGGFVPRFGGNNTDYSIAGGMRGALGGLGYDLSASLGVSDTDFFIKNTVNASLGPDTPRDFVPGAYKQKEVGFNADFNYGVDVDGWASPLNIAFGAEYREETFDITQGDAASFALGPLVSQGFSSSSNGFGGFNSSQSNSQDFYAGYLELEADITDALTLQGAMRYSDYQTFGDSLDYKIAGLYRVNDNVTLRSTYSTGFHAPSAGQATVRNVTTQIINGSLIDQGTIPLTTNPGQLAADFLEDSFGERPTLGTEKAKNLSFGTAFSTGPISWTFDYFNIKVDDRIALSDDIAFIDALNFLAANEGVTDYDNSTVANALTDLASAGALVRGDYVGFEDLTEFRFFTNSFSTKTQGIDIVAEAPLDFGQSGQTSMKLAANYTNTVVTDLGVVAPIDANRRLALEELLPEWRGNLTVNHQQGMWRGLLRANYYGPWFDNGNGYAVGGEFLFDAEIGAEVYEGVELILGAQNFLNNYPDENPGQTGTGQLYPEAGPFGFNGGQYYVKARYTF